MLTSSDMLFIAALLTAVCIFVSWTALQNKRVCQEAFREIESLHTYIQTMRLPGLYVIKNTQTGAEYFGSTKKNFMARWGQHVAELDQGKHGNVKLQEDWNFYGHIAFVFSIVEISDDVDTLLDRERQVRAERAQRIPPILNYNVAHRRVYVVPSAPDAEPIVPVFQAPKRRGRAQPTPIQRDTKPFILEDLLTPDEIAALGLEDDQ